MAFIMCLIYLATTPLWVSGESLSDLIHQNPSHLITNAEKTVQLNCSHSIKDYYMILWYQQMIGDSALNLVGYVYYESPTIESKYTNQFIVEGNGAKASVLKVTLEGEHVGSTAIYYCAASKDSNMPAYFGNGTKLTVLELNRTKAPDVEILKPSEIETGCKKRVTLVCVAKDFYPDHVSIRWSLGSEEIKDDIATDPYAIQDKDTELFSISSRLQVSKKDFKPKHNYTCTVKYYYETDQSKNVSGSIIGIEGDEYEPESYVNSAQWMKLAYGVFIAKSGLYGLVVLVYVMRKGSAGK